MTENLKKQKNLQYIDINFVFCIIPWQIFILEVSRHSQKYEIIGKNVRMSMSRNFLKLKIIGWKKIVTYFAHLTNSESSNMADEYFE